MPFRYVIVPEPITLLEPTTKEPLKDEKGVVKPIAFYDFISKLLFNPKWAENYKAIKAAKAIDKEFSGCINDAFGKNGPGMVKLAEEDWKRLHDLVENPNGQYGYHSAVMPQLLPFLDAIMEASDKEPTPPAT
jgi:hypothetical protein